MGRSKEDAGCDGNPNWRSCGSYGGSFKGYHTEGTPTQRYGVQIPIRQEPIRFSDRRGTRRVQKSRREES